MGHHNVIVLILPCVHARRSRQLQKFECKGGNSDSSLLHGVLVFVLLAGVGSTAQRCRICKEFAPYKHKIKIPEGGFGGQAGDSRYGLRRLE